MRRFVALPSALVLAAVFAPGPSVASTAEEFLNAPVWYLQYEVTLTSEYSGTYDWMHGKMSFTSKLERVLSDRKEFNLRSQGPGPIAMGAIAASAGSATSLADQQKVSMDMLANMDHQANWLAAGAGVKENPTDAEVAADTTPSSPCRINYLRVDTGKGLVDEMGAKYDRKATTTIKGEGKVLVMGMGSVILEMDTTANTYMLVLPIGSSPTGAGVERESVTVTTAPGGGSPSEERAKGEVATSYPDRVTLDNPAGAKIDGAALIRGKLDPASGKIAGEQTFKAHYKDGGNDAPATVVFKYTLTMTPPNK